MNAIPSASGAFRFLKGFFLKILREILREIPLAFFVKIIYTAVPFHLFTSRIPPSAHRSS